MDNLNIDIQKFKEPSLHFKTYRDNGIYRIFENRTIFDKLFGFYQSEIESNHILWSISYGPSHMNENR